MSEETRHKGRPKIDRNSPWGNRTGTTRAWAAQQRGAVVKGVIVLVLLIAVVGSALLYTFGTVVTPGEMGIRQLTMGPGQGFSNRALNPGYHWNIPFYSKIHMVPSTIQYLHLNRASPKDKSETGSHSSALEIQTTDGSSVEVDVSILYRFFPSAEEGHGGPADLMTQVGGPQEAVARIENAAVNELKKALGQLSTSEFYVPDDANKEMREAKMKLATKNIGERVKNFGVAIEAVLLRRYVYTDERIDSAIFNKNLQDQEERLSKAQGNLSEATAKLEEVKAELDTKIRSLQAAADRKITVLRSEGDLYETTKKANADLMVAQAQADVDRLRAKALVASSGAAVYMGKELAPLLASLRGGVVSKIDPYDLVEWMNRLGVATTPSASKRGEKKEADQRAPAAPAEAQ
jgi:hypothetical protein